MKVTTLSILLSMSMLIGLSVLVNSEVKGGGVHFAKEPKVQKYTVTPEEMVSKQILYVEGKPYLISRTKQGQIRIEKELTPVEVKAYEKKMKSTAQEVQRIEKSRKQTWERERQREGYKQIPVEGYETPRQPGRPLYEKEQRQIIMKEQAELEE